MSDSNIRLATDQDLPMIKQVIDATALFPSGVENKLRTLDARVLLVETSGTVEFTRTRSFYEHIGYTQEARIRDYYDKGDDKIVFYRAL